MFELSERNILEHTDTLAFVSIFDAGILHYTCLAMWVRLGFRFRLACLARVRHVCRLEISSFAPPVSARPSSRVAAECTIRDGRRILSNLINMSSRIEVVEDPKGQQTFKQDIPNQLH